MLHCWVHVVGARVRACDDAQVLRVGVSAYEPTDVLALLRDLRVQHVQLPCNLLDARWRSPEFLRTVAARPDVSSSGCCMLLLPGAPDTSADMDMDCEIRLADTQLSCCVEQPPASDAALSLFSTACR
eukprot:COSAG01_NODE_9379_length_2462_cov_11.333898_2_plen_128_part_00